MESIILKYKQTVVAVKKVQDRIIEILNGLPDDRLLTTDNIGVSNPCSGHRCHAET